MVRAILWVLFHALFLLSAVAHNPIQEKNMKTDILIPKAEVIRQTSLSGSSIWRLVKDGTFPGGKKISPNRVAWSQSEVSDWIVEKMGDVV